MGPARDADSRLGDFAIRCLFRARCCLFGFSLSLVGWRSVLDLVVAVVSLLFVCLVGRPVVAVVSLVLVCLIGVRCWFWSPRGCGGFACLGFWVAFAVWCGGAQNAGRKIGAACARPNNIKRLNCLAAL